MQTDFLRSLDFDAAVIRALFDLALEIKHATKRRRHLTVLGGRTSIMVFQKPSLRTRATFDIGVKQMGGHALYMGPTEVSMGERESVYDVARNLERWTDLIIARVFAQGVVDELAEVAGVPVINALSDEEHPCQAMADFFTLHEKGIRWSELKLAYVGDGNNVCHSLMAVAALLGAEMRVAGPAAYHPPAAFVAEVEAINRLSGGKLLVTTDPREAVRGANAVYTDIWASMGQEREAETRRKVFQAYQVNAALMAEAERGAFFMHDLPAHRGEEVTDEVMDGPTSICFDQAENRLHAQKAVILHCLGLVENAKAELAG